MPIEYAVAEAEQIFEKKEYNIEIYIYKFYIFHIKVTTFNFLKVFKYCLTFPIQTSSFNTSNIDLGKSNLNRTKTK